MTKKRVFNIALSLAVAICLFALIHSIDKLIYGLLASIVAIAFVGSKVKELIDWDRRK